MDRRERRRDRDREWAREGVWDEDEELIDRPPLPERLGKKVKRASREIGEDLSDEVERLGGRLRGWSEDVGRKAERLTEGLGDGIERAGRSSRRWLSDDESDERPRRWRKQKERQRLDEIDDEVRLRPEKAKERIRPRLAEEEEVEEEVEEEEEGNGRRGWSWFGWGGWRRPDREEEEVPEGRIADVKFNSDVDVVCIDSSIASEQAFRYALRNIPRGHTLLLVHGIFTPPGAIDSKLEDEKEMLRVKGKFLNLCRRNGRRCAYREFEFTTNNELGEKVCRIADRQHAGSVILGKRAEASELRRAVLGSPSLSVMQECDVPVTLIAERKEGSLD